MLCTCVIYIEFTDLNMSLFKWVSLLGPHIFGLSSSEVRMCLVRSHTKVYLSSYIHIVTIIEYVCDLLDVTTLMRWSY